MNTNQLVAGTLHISDAVTSNQLVEQYQRLIDLCRQASDIDRGAFDAPVREYLIQLANSSRKIDAIFQEKSCKGIIKAMGADDLFGKEHDEALARYVAGEGADYSMLAAALEDDRKRLLNLVASLNALTACMDPFTDIVSNDAPAVVANGTGRLLKIYFDDVRFGSKIDHFEKFFRIWGRIIDAFTMLAEENFEETSVFEVESGAVTFAIGEKALSALSEGMCNLLTRYKKVLEIKRLELELVSLELTISDQLEAIIDDEVRATIYTACSSITTDLLDTYGWIGTPKQEDISSMVKTSLMQILTFVERGGVIYSSHASELKKLNDDIASALKLHEANGSFFQVAYDATEC